MIIPDQFSSFSIFFEPFQGYGENAYRSSLRKLHCHSKFNCSWVCRYKWQLNCGHYSPYVVSIIDPMLPWLATTISQGRARAHGAGEERTTGPPLYADLGLGAKDYEHGIGRERGYMERGPDSVQEFDGSKARGDRRGEGERDDHENTLPLIGRVSGQVRFYGESGSGVGGSRQRRANGPRAWHRNGEGGHVPT